MWSTISMGIAAPRPNVARPKSGSFCVCPLMSRSMWSPLSFGMSTPRAPMSTTCCESEVTAPSERKSMASESVRMP